jgi:RimJ/RimL family protein N-acetyltransferase
MEFLSYNPTSYIKEEDIINFYNKVSKQTEYLGIYEGEYTYNFNVDKDLMIIAYTTEIIGIITISIPNKRKNIHVGTLAIAINNDYCNKGIGRELMSRALEWFKNNSSLTRLQLFVRTDNLRAIALYKKYDFLIEGEMRNDTCIDGKYYNVYIMSVLKASTTQYDNQ